MEFLAQFIRRLRPATAPRESVATAVTNAPISAARNVGLHDSVLSGWFNNENGEIYKGVPIRPEDVVVDVGCGEGLFLAFCGKQGPHAIGIDCDQESLDRARQRLEETSARRKECFLANAETLPLASGLATRVLCTEVLEHVDDPIAVLQELVRIGAPGCIYLFTVPDPVAELVQKEIAPPFYFQKPNHIRIFSRDEFAKTVSEAGLEITHRDSYGFYWSVWWAMFWACDVDFASPNHPALDHWSEAWDQLIHTRDGLRVKQALDAVMPKSQLIVARKPGADKAND